MISIVNEAINRKLASISFTSIVVGKVESVNPLRIRINDRIVIGQSFIEPMSLGLNDYSPNSALPLVVGETIQMVRYNNGQRFYILGKSTTAGTIDYSQLNNLPRLITTNTTSQECCSEKICNDINLHKVAKSGKYTDLVDADKILSTNTTQSISAKKTFTVLPESSVTPTSDNQLVNKSYVDTNFLQFDVIGEF